MVTPFFVFAFDDETQQADQVSSRQPQTLLVKWLIQFFGDNLTNGIILTLYHKGERE